MSAHGFIVVKDYTHTSRCVPFGEVGAVDGEKPDPGEADLVRRAEDEPDHDGDEGQLNKHAIALLDDDEGDEDGEERRRALDRLHE